MSVKHSFQTLQNTLTGIQNLYKMIDDALEEIELSSSEKNYIT
jgi:hypothetical protein